MQDIAGTHEILARGTVPREIQLRYASRMR
jgi:hypothetical protein